MYSGGTCTGQERQEDLCFMAKLKIVSTPKIRQQLKTLQNTKLTKVHAHLMLLTEF